MKKLKFTNNDLNYINEYEKVDIVILLVIE